MQKAAVPVASQQIFAGRLRRYYGVPLWRQLLDVPTVLSNIRDVGYVGIGFLQSLWILRRFKPDVVFAKGGFVCLPLGMAAHMLHIPIVIHDSDARAGLTNSVLSKWARFIATGAPLENYKYPQDRTFYTGIPVDAQFKPVGKTRQQQYKADLGLHDTTRPLVVVTGGGLGARAINQAVVAVAPKLLDKTAFYHITGEKNYGQVIDVAPEHVDYIVTPFVSDGMTKVFGAADVVITRAGATAIGELAAMGKAVIMIPAAQLTDQNKNAPIYQKAGAAVVIEESALVANPTILQKAIEKLVEQPAARLKLAKALHGFARPDAAIELAGLIVKAVKKNP